MELADGSFLDRMCLRNPVLVGACEETCFGRKASLGCPLVVGTGQGGDGSQGQIVPQRGLLPVLTIDSPKGHNVLNKFGSLETSFSSNMSEMVQQKLSYSNQILSVKQFYQSIVIGLDSFASPWLDFLHFLRQHPPESFADVT